MLELKRRRRSVPAVFIMLLLLCLLLTAASCGNRALDEATRLNQSAGQDITEIERIVRSTS